MNHIALVQNVKEAVSEVFSDTSVERKDTLESLKEILEDVEVLIDILEADGE